MGLNSQEKRYLSLLGVEINGQKGKNHWFLHIS